MTPLVHRRGFLLPIVLVVVMTMTLAVSVFAEQMLAEYRATHSMTLHVQAGNAALSGLSYLQVSADRLRKQGQSLNSWISGADRSSFGSNFHQSIDDETNLSFTIASHRDRTGIVSGLANESRKINLYGLPQDSSNVLLVRKRLMTIPRMTPQIADAIMDWIDKDESTRPLGAESGWYIETAAPRVPSKEPIRDLAELLQVRGVTAELLFGEDLNRNGWLDASEDDGEATAPLDNADGKLDGGWSDYLTVLGQESNYRDQRTLKVNVNQENLVQLYDQLQPLVGPVAATYIVALRLEGPLQFGKIEVDSQESQIAERRRTAEERLRSQLESKAKEQSRRTDTVRGGIDLGRQPAYTIRSMVDLIDQDVRTIVDGQQQLLKSPWTLATLDGALASLEQSLTTNDEPVNRTRINLLAAPMVVLRSVPGMDESRVSAIASARAGRRHSKSHASIAWLVDEGIFSLEQLREVAPYLTSGGDVFTGTSIGTIPHRGFTSTPQAASQKMVLGAGVHFVLDCSQPLSQILSCQNSLPLMLPMFERPRQ